MSILSDIFNTDADDAAECGLGACADYEEEEPFRLLPATPAEWMAAFATVFVLWSLYCAAVVVQP